MKLETENVKETEASAELVRELMADDARRGEFMILSDEADAENFVQVACDYDDAGGKSDGCFGEERRMFRLGISRRSWESAFPLHAPCRR